MQNRDLLTVILIAIILALMVPLSASAWQTTKAFTYDNLIWMDTGSGRR